MADAITAIPAAAKAFMQANPNATIAQQVKANPPSQTPPLAAPPQKTSTPTVVTDANIRENAIPDITQRTQAALTPRNATSVVTGPAPEGATLSSNGNYVDKAGNQYSSAPAAVGAAGAVAGASLPAPAKASGTPAADQAAAPDNEYDSFLKSIFDENPSSATQGAAPTNDPYLAMLSTMRATSDNATKTMIGATQQTFAQRRAQLDATDAASRAGLMQSLISSGQTRYAPILAGQAMTAEETAHVVALSNIDAEESSAVAQLQKAQSDQDFQAMGKELDHLDSLRQDKISTASKLADSAAAATKAINDAKQHETDGINKIAEEAAKNGADPQTMAAITSATSESAAVAAAGDSLQSATGQLGDYLQYKRDTVNKGLTPTDYGTWKAQDDARQAKADASAAYSKAYAAAKGAADAVGTPTDDTTLTPDPAATGITAATGLSLQAYNFLTQGTASMSRMPAAQRNAIMKEANDWLNKHGIDISTFQSQYQSYNDVLKKNIERANQTKIMAGEVSGSADALISAIEGDKSNTDLGASVTGVAGMSNLRAANVLDLMLGKATNSKFAQTYSTQLRFMANDLAGYLAASRGASSPELQDQRDASEIVANGMNKGSTQAFKDAVNANEEKVSGVVGKAVDDAHKQVWDLFGVGSQYKAPAPQLSDAEAKAKVDAYVKENPDQADNIAKLYEVPGAHEQDVYDYIQLLDKQ